MPILLLGYLKPNAMPLIIGQHWKYNNASEISINLKTGTAGNLRRVSTYTTRKAVLCKNCGFGDYK
jgi:hypothetical protein